MSRSGEDTRPSVISSIFGVVGRELQQFVLSAAGINPPAETSSSRSNSPQKVRTKRKAGPSNVYDEEAERRPRKRARTSSPEIIRDHRRRQMTPEQEMRVSSPVQPPTSTYTPPDYAQDSEIDSDDGSRSPTPVKRRATSRMPGALYDLSSPEPESQEDRHVRFAADVISPPLQRAPSVHPPERPNPRRVNDLSIRPKQRDIRSTASHYSDGSYATPPPSTTDSEDLHSRLDPSSRYTGSFSSTLPTHSRSSSMSQISLDKDVVRLPRAPVREDSFSFASVSERSMEQERINALEEEVRKLKEELARRSSTIPAAPAPPPPPPPPPPPLGLPQPSRIPSQGREKGTSTVLMGARASLKSTPSLPAPTVNPTSNMKSTVPAAQMAAFLNEMKTVKLRKVSSKPELGEGSSKTTAPFKSSVMERLGSSSSFSIPRPRYALSQDSVSTQSVGSSFAPSDHSLASSQASTSTTRLSELRTNRVAEFTPSLVSDNGDLHDEEHLPSTPPPSTSQATTSRNRHSMPVPKASGVPEASNERQRISRNNIPSTSEEGGGSERARTNSFPNRPNTSGPLPSLSPDKPRPPGRATNRKTAPQRTVVTSSSDEDNDPIALLGPRHPVEYSVPLRGEGRSSGKPHRYRTESVAKSQHSRSRSHSRAPTPAASSGGNLPSLEAELRKIVRAEVEREFEQEIQDLDAHSGRVLSGTGQRSSQRDGFMAGGGGGGVPVWMGGGDDDDEDEGKPSRGQSTKSRYHG
ncbi:hypothetical protein M408DRAFT_19973 [Serendipita vermifera MAFF 305830]|uniref:Uncharacterized protein n=1 Tax=Serendipita vermifera MAFF 305830 TaxID=933852 RepID=A0A0C3B6Z0_SERVB|nr:hypothetical protein M408DRAFT_19973 [Serendipita vermifera MAFF 305830]